MPSQNMKEAANVCFHTCLPNPFLSQHESENPTSNLTSSAAESRRFFATTTAASFFPATQFTNPESLPSLEDAFAQFVESYPDYSNSYQIDEIRAKEYYNLSLTNHVCLDYIGIGLFAFSQFHNQLCSTYPTASTSSPPTQLPSEISDCPLFNLSHRSVNLKLELLNSTRESKLESAIKERISGFLNINTDDYSVVFTANRTAAFKLLAESYPFQSNKKLLTVYDHQSEAVDAMVSSSGKRGAKAMAAEFTWPRLRVQSTNLKSMLISKSKKKKKQGLFVFQLQSRVTGARYSYQWMQIAQENGWHVLLDACALGPKDMGSFGLSLLQPDFLICSFYKVFGENPTGFGCLFVKKSAISLLEDSAIVGIASIVPANRFLHPHDQPTESDTQEDSTTNSDRQEAQQDPSIKSISTNSWRAQEEESPANEIAESDPSNGTPKHQNHAKSTENNQAKTEFRCLDHVDSLGLTLINSRGRYLTNWLINALMKLHHPNSESDAPLVRIYGPKIKFDRGPALAFNVFDWKGEKVDPILVQKLSDRKGISLSHGFLQHIWFPDKYEGEKGRALEKRKWESDEKGVKVVTAALGYMADFRDVYRLWSFVAQFLDADFVEKERWRYTALNQNTVEI